jgi:predicted lipoprotein
MRKTVFVVLLLLSGCEIRPLDPETGKAIIEEQQQVFDANTFVEEHWDDRILPTILNDGMELTDLLAGLNEDLEGASSKFGYREGNRPFNFIIRGTGRVLRVDRTSRAGVLAVDLPPYDDTSDVALQIGPVIRGTALRDALPFINFNQFVNQLEYAQVSNALHTRLYTSILKQINFNSIVQNEISFSGVFTLRNLDEIMITPVAIQVGG